MPVVPARATLRTADALVAAGLIEPVARDAVASVEHRYAVAITPAMRALIRQPDDPIGRQFIPDPAELITAPHESSDPIADDALSPIKGVVHRYPDRALLKPLLVCPVYCRFCFRREHVGPDGGLLTEAELQAAYAWFAARPTIREVILTGGDPLMLSPRRLGAIVAALSAIPHIELLRVHTRVPVADPALVTDALAAAMEGEKPLWLVVHANHAREFTPDSTLRVAPHALPRHSIARPVGAAARCQRQRRGAGGAVPRHARCPGEAVLPASARPRSRHRAFPRADRGGTALLATLRGRVTGLAWPTYVLDIPGGHGKVPIGPDYLEPDGSVRDPGGTRHSALPGLP